MRPSDREVAAVSSDARRFRRYHPMAMEVLAYSSSHGGQLPEFVFELDEQRWDELAATLREMDDLAWVRRMVGGDGTQEAKSVPRVIRPLVFPTISTL